MDLQQRLAGTRIAIVGLGYVGLPLAVEFGKQYPTVGYDIHAARVQELARGRDSTLEVEPDLLAQATHLTFTDQRADIAACNVYIVTVPTPIDAAKRPDLTPLVKASEALGSVLKPGDTVIYESTVYPGCTEEVCVPILERVSGLAFEANAPTANAPAGAAHGRDAPVGAAHGRDAPAGAAHGRDAPAGAAHGRDALAGAAHGRDALAGAAHGRDALAPEEQAHRGHGPLLQQRAPNTFAIGYSPERINPGDKAHRVTNILKVTSGSTPETADFVDALYASIITAGTHKAPSIKVAEAAKVIENTQRDLNIALVNDLAILFRKLGIDTLDVLEAAGTKWNFLPFRPGLVGGHCISVDPYYLTHKAQEVGHHPQVILAGRRTNDGMGPFVADQTLKLMLQKGINPVRARILILGLAFKENCPDLRNTRVVDIIDTLRGYNCEVDVYDPWVDAAEAEHEYGLRPIAKPEPGRYDAMILAVGHDQFRALGGQGVRAFGKPDASVVYDVKHVLPREAVDGRL
jgi:UDP-N-acetyl-D-galactosamine dehydrogenase